MMPRKFPFWSSFTPYGSTAEAFKIVCSALVSALLTLVWNWVKVREGAPIVSSPTTPRLFDELFCALLYSPQCP